jgi:hypothetical protein
MDAVPDKGPCAGTCSGADLSRAGRAQPLEADTVGLAQQQLCLQKFEIVHHAWDESMRLGQSVRVPFVRSHLTVRARALAGARAAASRAALGRRTRLLMCLAAYIPCRKCSRPSSDAARADQQAVHG